MARSSVGRSSLRHFTLLALLAMSLFLAPSVIADDPTPEPPPRVLIVRSSDASAYRSAEERCREQLAGTPVSIHSRTLETWESWSSVEEEERADLCVAIGSKAAQVLAVEVPHPIPLVYCLVSDSRKVGLEGRPRTWGISTQVTATQRIELLTAAFPKEHRLGLLHSPSEEGRRRVDELRRHLPEGWELDTQETIEKEFVANLDSLLSRNPTIVIALPDARVFTKHSRRVLLEKAYRARIPVFGYSRGFVEAGALIGTAIDPGEQGRRAGELVSVALASPHEEPPVHEPPLPTPYLNVSVLEILDIEASPKFLERPDLRRVGREEGR